MKNEKIYEDTVRKLKLKMSNTKLEIVLVISGEPVTVMVAIKKYSRKVLKYSNNVAEIAKDTGDKNLKKYVHCTIIIT